MKLNGLPQGGRRASDNRSLLSSLQQDGDTSGVARERIHRRAKHTLLSVPDTERAELSDVAVHREEIFHRIAEEVSGMGTPAAAQLSDTPVVKITTKKLSRLPPRP
jgi:hypothetical protein